MFVWRFCFKLEGWPPLSSHTAWLTHAFGTFISLNLHYFFLYSTIQKRIKKNENLKNTIYNDDYCVVLKKNVGSSWMLCTLHTRVQMESLRCNNLNSLTDKVICLLLILNTIFYIYNPGYTWCSTYLHIAKQKLMGCIYIYIYAIYHECVQVFI